MTIHFTIYRTLLSSLLSFMSVGIFTLLISAISINPVLAQNVSISISNNDNETKIKYKNGSNSFDIEMKGEITLSDDDSDIIGISDGGFFEIQKKAFGSKRKIIIESDRNGVLNRRYFIGRKEKEYVPTGQSWLANILPDVVKSTGLGAEARVKRIYAQGGAKAVIEEISDLDGDHVITTYYNYLLEKDLSGDEVILLLDNIGRNLESDHYISDILRSHDDVFLISPQSTDAYIRSVKSLESDHYMSEVLKDIIDNNKISDNQVNSLLEITEGLESDHYMTEVLRDLIDERDLTSLQSTKLVELIGEIDSDHYTTEVLTDLLDERELSDEVLSIITKSLDNISSDHYLTEIVKAASQQNMNEKTLRQLLNAVNENISSDHYHLESIESILDNTDLSLNLSMPIILSSIDGISSDNYAAELIEKVTDMDDITDDNLIQILDAISDLNSDSYKSKCLENISDLIDEDNTNVYKAYKRAARTINSESYYGRAMRAID